MLFNRNALAEAAKKSIGKHLKVSCEEWQEGSFVYVFQLSLAETAEIAQVVLENIVKRQNKKTASQSDPNAANLKIVMLACCDEDGNKLFLPGDEEKILQCPAIVVERIVRAYNLLNEVVDDEIEEAKKN